MKWKGLNHAHEGIDLTLLHSEWPKPPRVLAVGSAIGVKIKVSQSLVGLAYAKLSLILYFAAVAFPHWSAYPFTAGLTEIVNP